MKKQSSAPQFIASISVLHKLLDLPKPTHPLVNVHHLKGATVDDRALNHPLPNAFYSISLKMNFEGKVKYGQQYYDFDEGLMAFTAPNQVMTIEANDSPSCTGFAEAITNAFTKYL